MKKSSKVVAYPAPAGEGDSSTYQVEVDGKPVDVYKAQTKHHDKRYFFASFDFSGTVGIRIATKSPLEKLKILPVHSLDSAEVVEGGILLKASSPFQISLEPDGRNSPLLLFGNGLEKDAPRPDEPGVVYFGPGTHCPGKISLTDGQTLYIAGGAVVKGAVEAKGVGVSIRGRGILDGSDWPHFDGPANFMIGLERCRNARVSDLIVRGSWTWTVVPCGCDSVLIENVKICGSRVGNDDGVDICNSSDVSIRNCFVRTDDDCIAIKGLEGFGGKPCERIAIENCRFWADMANIFRIGYESDATAMREITAREVDAIHLTATPRAHDAYWSHEVVYVQPSNGMLVEKLSFERFRVNSEAGCCRLLRATPMLTSPARFQGGQIVCGESYKIPGRIKGARLVDFEIEGKTGDGYGDIYVAGFDDSHMAEDVSLKGLRRVGNPEFLFARNAAIGPHVKDIDIQ